MAKVINTKKPQIEDVIEVEVEGTYVPYPHKIKTVSVGKSDLTTPLGAERLHAKNVWNKTRPKARRVK